MPMQPGRQFDFTGRSSEVTDINAYREARARLRSSKNPIQVAQYAHNPYRVTQDAAEQLKSEGWKHTPPKTGLGETIQQAGGIARFLGLVEDREPGK